MTTRRRDNHSSPFGLWLRDQREIDSKRGFIATDIDYIWKNYITNEWLLLEEKRYGKKPTRPQINMFSQIDRYLLSSKLYRGYYIASFENTSPDDGLIDLGRVNSNVEAIKYKAIDRWTFLQFLQFNFQL